MEGGKRCPEMNFGNLSEAQNAVHEGKHRGIFKTGTVSQGCFPMKQPLYPGPLRRCFTGRKIRLHRLYGTAGFFSA